MSPTPQAFARQPVRARRPRNANPYDAAHHTTPVAQPAPTTRHIRPPTLDEDEDDTTGMDGLEGEDTLDGDVVDVTEEIDDGDGTADGEGVIEEGEPIPRSLQDPSKSSLKAVLRQDV